MTVLAGENQPDGMGFFSKGEFFMLTALLKKIFGTKSQRDVRRMLPMVAKINRIEEELQKFADEAQAAIDAATEFAKASPEPDMAAALDSVYVK